MGRLTIDERRRVFQAHEASAAGSLTWRGVEFHPLASLLDAVLPRA